MSAQGGQSDSFLRCLECGRTEEVNFGRRTLEGWPKCCGATMRLVRTDADVGASVKAALNAQGLANGGWIR